MTSAQILLSLAAAASVLYTIFGYPKMYGALTGRSRLYRTAGMFLLDLLLVLILIGVSTDFHDGVPRALGATRYITFWTACLALGLSLPLIALLDALESFVAVRRERRDFVRTALEEERARLLQFAREQEAKIAAKDTVTQNRG